MLEYILWIALVLSTTASFLIAAKVPFPVIFWGLGPILGILTIFTSVLDPKIETLVQWYDKVCATKLCDLYLIAVVTSASALGDAFELAWWQTPDESQDGLSVWAILCFFNIIFLVFVATVAYQALNINNTRIGVSFLGRRVLVWSCILFSVAFGFVFRLALELKRKRKRKKIAK
jgi:peptidoglycan biosynthesis protein MviN/MurJ (putative lipid II flippase)